MWFEGLAAGSWWIDDWMAIIFNVFVQWLRSFRLFRPTHIHHNQLFITSLLGLHVCLLRACTLAGRRRSRGRVRGARQLKQTETCRASVVCVPQIFVSSSFTTRPLSFFRRIALSPPIIKMLIFRFLFFFSSYSDPFLSLRVRFFRSFICSVLCAIAVAIVVILHPERTAWTLQQPYVCIHVTYVSVSVCSCENPLWSKTIEE